MTAALTPELALAYLHQLSADIRAAIVLDDAGNVLAGPPALAAPARALLAAATVSAPDANGARGSVVVCARSACGFAFGARDERHAVVVAAGPLALSALVLHDLRSVLAALGGRMPDTPVSEAPEGVADAVLGVC
jgi:hypothetical protein